MRSDPITQDADVVISALNDRIKAYQDEINERREKIRQLEDAKRLHDKSAMPIAKTNGKKPRKSKKGKKNKKARIAEAIDKATGKFKSSELWDKVNNDGHGAVDKATFYSTFSRMKGEYYQEVVDTDERGFYEKIKKN
jgi:hypothetical protein